MHDTYRVHTQDIHEPRKTWPNVLSWMFLTLVAGIAILTGALAMPAYAADGSIAIAADGQAGTTEFDAYLLFRADISEDGEATQVAWPDEGTKEVLLGLLDAHDYGAWLGENHPGTAQHDKAQNAASYLTVLLEAPADTEDSPDATESACTRATQIARGIVSSEEVPHQTVVAGAASTCEQGLWLLVSSEDARDDASNGGAATAPLLVSVGSKPVALNLKTGMPTVDKRVRTDDSPWSSVATAQAGEDIDFVLTATLPSNFASFDHYHLRFEDSLGTSLAISKPGGEGPEDCLRVFVDDQPVAIDDAHVAARLEAQTMEVDFPDLRDAWWSKIAPDAESVIRIEYRAHLTSDATSRAEGNPNKVRLVYTNDPVRLSESTSDEVVAHVFTHTLALAKTSSDGKTPLPGATFTIMPKPPEGTDSLARYVQKDGSIASTPYAFATDKQGHLIVSGLDEGSYVISEQEAPKGYQKLDGPLELSIETELDEPGKTRSALTATVTTKQAKLTKADANTGVIVVSVANDPADPGTTPDATPDKSPTERLAQTGGGPAALVLLVVGIAMIVGSKRPRKPS